LPSKRILCVDDDPATLSARKLLLEDGGYSVVTASSGREALALLAAGLVVDLVLLDYIMPGMTGDELARALRQQYPELLLVIISAVGQLPPELIKISDASHQKGQDPESLLATVAKVLEQPSPGAGKASEAAQRTILCVDDEDQQLQYRRELFESAGYRVLEAQSANEAMDTFSHSHIDAVVMDYWLSGHGRNGTALAEQMKRMRPRTPIVMLSGFASLPGEGVIVDSWMHKAEVEPESLVNEVERLIELRARQHADKSE
jgi:CheY-like chemotaxis protein